VEQARAAEDAGFSLVTVMDHLYQIGGVGAVDEPMRGRHSTLSPARRNGSGSIYRTPEAIAAVGEVLSLI
jgi:alkanesulfonate monooxygenase SsuD/methylene tetrahydromethanopterin reductase-like flavin-dependent oxidoreductase (luciferase family)